MRAAVYERMHQAQPPPWKIAFKIARHIDPVLWYWARPGPIFQLHQAVLQQRSAGGVSGGDEKAVIETVLASLVAAIVAVVSHQPPSMLRACTRGQLKYRGGLMRAAWWVVGGARATACCGSE